ncbi:MAG: phage Gp37/Gp68 family protein [Saprospiraceae bacterium]
MAAKSSIEWTEVTWNPVTGCDKVSAGCKNCYAEKMALRLQAMGTPQYKNGFSLSLAPQALEIPRKWKKRRVVFVNSMSDLFHEDVPISYIKKVFKVMNETHHIYQVLTKRSKRLMQIADQLNWTENIWMGVSVENETFTYRIDELSKIASKVKFLSIEPLIGHVKTLNLANIDWVIVGGESGPKARVMKKEWVDFIQSKCAETKTPFFFKQWGKPKFNDNPNDPTIDQKHVNHAKGGCELDGVIYRELPKKIELMK